MPQFSDDIHLGPAVSGALSAGPTQMGSGVGPMGRVYVFDVVPLTLQTSGLATAQAVATAKDLTLTAGTGVTTRTRLDGTVEYILDTPRTVSVDSSGVGDTTQTATVYGYDVYGQAMSEAVALNGTTEVYTTKAFKSVTRIAISAATAGNINAGFADTFGLPVRVTDAGYVVSVKWNNTLAADAGTFAAADTTSPATTTTDDVRGTYTPSSAADGSKRLVMALAIPALGCGPNATRVGAYGVDQV